MVAKQLSSVITGNLLKFGVIIGLDDKIDAIFWIDDHLKDNIYFFS